VSNCSERKTNRSEPKKALQRRQRRWADAAGIAYDAGGYVQRLGDNLRAPLSSAASSAFVASPELGARRRQPPKMLALHSSAALVANVFDYWTQRDASPLAAALGFAEPCTALGFEAPFPSGLPGEPPTVDLLLTFESGRRIAVESKFSEWLSRRPRNKAVFKTKYFPRDRAVWTECGLPRCQTLAEDLQARTQRFKYLHAAQLLKHALGLSVVARGRIALCYFYYDWPCRESGVHREEIARFTGLIGDELPFSALTYQEIYRRLRETRAVEPGYLEYLRARYFS
jgi:Restriction Endonuclease associating with ARP